MPVLAPVTSTAFALLDSAGCASPGAGAASNTISKATHDRMTDPPLLLDRHSAWRIRTLGNPRRLVYPSEDQPRRRFNGTNQINEFWPVAATRLAAAAADPAPA